MVTQQHRTYWKKNLQLTSLLLLLWFFVSFVITWFARDLQFIHWLGFPLPFYVAAQGAPLLFVIIVWYYARTMDKLDKKYGVQEDEQ